MPPLRLCLLLLAVAGAAWGLPTLPQTGPCSAGLRLRPTADGEQLTVLVLSDLHYGEDAALDERTTALQRALIKHAAPDLVVYNGDLTSEHHRRHGRSCFAAADDAACWAAALRPAVEAGVPFATTFGNHDAPPGAGHGAFAARQRAEHAAFPQLSCSGDGGDLLGSRVVLRDASGAAVVGQLSLLNSVDRHDDGGLYSGYGRVSVAEQAAMEAGVLEVPRGMAQRPWGGAHVALVHVPPPLFRRPQRIAGSRNESTACQPSQFPAAAALDAALLRSADAVASGHDHGNDFVGEVDRPPLPPLLAVYGRKSGYGEYSHGALPGGRRLVITLTRQVGLNTLAPVCGTCDPGEYPAPRCAGEQCRRFVSLVTDLLEYDHLSDAVADVPPQPMRPLGVVQRECGDVVDYRPQCAVVLLLLGSAALAAVAVRTWRARRRGQRRRTAV